MPKGKKKKKKKKEQKIVSSNDKVQTTFSAFAFWLVFTMFMNEFLVLRNHTIFIPNKNVLKRLSPA